LRPNRMTARHWFANEGSTSRKWAGTTDPKQVCSG
jgi:hypothetical protein